MAGLTWDMITSGPEAGTVIAPPTYTADEDQSTRVEVYLSLATELGTWLLKVKDGLDHERMLLSTTTDVEREQLVTELVLDHPRVVDVTAAEVVTSADGLSVAVSANFTTITGASVSLGATI